MRSGADTVHSYNPLCKSNLFAGIFTITYRSATYYDLKTLSGLKAIEKRKVTFPNTDKKYKYKPSRYFHRPSLIS